MWKYNNELYHWGVKGMKWRNHKEKLDDKAFNEYVENYNFENNPPKNYSPKLTAITIKGVPGYMNDRGEFFSLKSAESIKLQSWRADCRYNKKKIETAKTKYKHTVNPLDTLGSYIVNGEKKISKYVNKTTKSLNAYVKKGEKKITKFFNKIF